MPETKTTKAAPAKKPACPTLQEKFSNILAELRNDSDREDALPIFLKEQQISFDVICEEAAQTSTFWQHTPDGKDRLVWTYEADLTVRWTNVEKPTEKLEARIHAIGSSDEGPAAAKTAAWSSALGAYLGAKFWQPPEAYYTPLTYISEKAAQELTQRGTQPRNAPQGINTQQNAKNAPQAKSDSRRTLTGPQMDRMYKKAEAAGVTMQQVNEELRKRYNAEDPHTITRAQYDEICRSLDDMARNRQGGQHE